MSLRVNSPLLLPVHLNAQTSYNLYTTANPRPTAVARTPSQHCMNRLQLPHCTLALITLQPLFDNFVHLAICTSPRTGGSRSGVYCRAAERRYTDEGTYPARELMRRRRHWGRSWYDHSVKNCVGVGSFGTLSYRPDVGPFGYGVVCELRPSDVYSVDYLDQIQWYSSLIISTAWR